MCYYHYHQNTVTQASEPKQQQILGPNSWAQACIKTAQNASYVLNMFHMVRHVVTSHDRNVQLQNDQLCLFSPYYSCRHRISWFPGTPGLHGFCSVHIWTGAPSVPAQSTRGDKRSGAPYYDNGRTREQRSSRISLEMQKGRFGSGWSLS